MPIGELPNLLCALGEAPTQLELNNIFSECRGTVGVMHRLPANAQSTDSNGEATESDGISFERFLELYLNQRASQPFQYSDVVTAFKQVSRGQDGEEMSPEALTKLLLTVRHQYPYLTKLKACAYRLTLIKLVNLLLMCIHAERGSYDGR